MSGHVHFLLPDLTAWDKTQDQALVLGFFSDERPLRGAAGLADWRLCGRLSHLLSAGRLVGRRGETLILPPAGARLSFSRIVLFGLGDSAEFDETLLREEIRRMRFVLDRADVRRYAVQVPGRATGLLSARRALALWLEESSKDGVVAEVALIESAAGQKEMAEALRARPRSGSASAAE